MPEEVLPEKHEPKRLVLTRDDFIEFILRTTKDDSIFRVYDGDGYILVGIDKEPEAKE